VHLHRGEQSGLRYREPGELEPCETASPGQSLTVGGSETPHSSLLPPPLIRLQPARSFRRGGVCSGLIRKRFPQPRKSRQASGRPQAVLPSSRRKGERMGYRGDLHFRFLSAAAGCPVVNLLQGRERSR
jgi:hypothetical protein